MRTLLASSLALAMTAACASDPAAPPAQPDDPVMPDPQAIGVTAPAAARLIRGQTVMVPVTVTRQGYDGDITVSVTELPAGVSAEPVVVPAGQTTGQLSLVCSSGIAIATYGTMTVRANADGLDASTPLDVHLTDPAGALDLTFAVGGKRTMGFHSAANEAAWRVALQPDGKLLVAGIDWTAKGFLLSRLLENGDLDPDFGTGGVIAIPDGGASLGVGGMIVRTDGSILLGVNTGSNGIVYAFDSTGKLDTSWNGSGAAVINSSTIGVNFALRGLALTTDGHVLAGGYAADFEVVRLDAQGLIDTSFDGDGLATIDVGGAEQMFAFAVRPDGRIVMAGSSTTGYMSYAIAQLTPDGAPDTSFSGDGKVRLDIGAPSGFERAVVLGDGRLALSGYYDGSHMLTMVKPNGDLDLSFSGDGFAPVAQGVYAMTDAGDGFIAVGSAPGGKQMSVSKFGMDGSLVPSFGTNGTTAVDVTGESTYLFGVAVDSQDRLVTVGWAGAGTELGQFLVARFWE